MSKNKINILFGSGETFTLYSSLENRNERKCNETEKSNFEKSNKGETEYYIGNIQKGEEMRKFHVINVLS